MYCCCYCNIYIYIYIHTYTHVHIYIYIYTDTEREREREIHGAERPGEAQDEDVLLMLYYTIYPRGCIYVYI